MEAAESAKSLPVALSQGRVAPLLVCLSPAAALEGSLALWSFRKAHSRVKDRTVPPTELFVYLNHVLVQNDSNHTTLDLDSVLFSSNTFLKL